MASLGSGKQNGHRRFSGPGPRADKAEARRAAAQASQAAWRAPKGWAP